MKLIDILKEIKLIKNDNDFIIIRQYHYGNNDEVDDILMACATGESSMGFFFKKFTYAEAYNFANEVINGEEEGGIEQGLNTSLTEFEVKCKKINLILGLVEEEKVYYFVFNQEGFELFDFETAHANSVKYKTNINDQTKEDAINTYKKQKGMKITIPKHVSDSEVKVNLKDTDFALYGIKVKGTLVYSKEYYEKIKDPTDYYRKHNPKKLGISDEEYVKRYFENPLPKPIKENVDRFWYTIDSNKLLDKDQVLLIFNKKGLYGYDPIYIRDEYYKGDGMSGDTFPLKAITEWFRDDIKFTKKINVNLPKHLINTLMKGIWKGDAIKAEEIEKFFK